ncbi:MAG: N-acetylmuramoyl-L-alanine amidase [Clostridia bacterium]|nr:N-acetylmuramoyl-L-alanine amidase [Clostridia bacterium]MDH7571963.1 N-acetylmuramoyl-L-alanine amidase [Clostridia bacterium]
MIVIVRGRHLRIVLAVILVLILLGVWRWARREESFPVFSWLLAGRRVVVDPGHGGVDPGAVGPAGTREKDVTLAISLRLRDLLAQAGAAVVMTRETDVDLGSPGKSLGARKREDLDRRIAIAREHEAEIYLGIQANAFGTRWRGAQTFYHPSSEEGRLLAEAIQAELIRILGNTNRRAKSLELYLLRNLTVPAAVIVEVGFLSNPEEERLLNDPYYQQKVALAVYSGVIRYLAGRVPEGSSP